MIHLNFGLHDLKHVDGRGRACAPDAGDVQVPLQAYARNLDALVERMGRAAGRLVFATTTPVPAGARWRRPGDELAWNAAALAVMERRGVEVDDLYGFCLPLLDRIQLQRDVHFTDEGYALLGERVAAAIRGALGRA